MTKYVMKKIKDKSIIYDIFGIKSDNSIMWEFYCIFFIEFMIVGKTLLVYTKLFTPNDYKKWQDNI